MPAEIVFLSILSFIILIFWFGYPLLVLVHCWQNKNLPQDKKILWTAFIIITWLFVALGAVIYGLIYHRRQLKAIPALGLLAIIVFSSYVVSQTRHGTLLPVISAYGYTEAEKALAQTVKTPEKLTLLLTDIAQLRHEEEQDRSLLEKNMSLLAYLAALAKDDITDAELTDWKSLFNRRATLSATEVKIAHTKFLRAGQDTGK